jgi:transcriptional regulator with AAA-type ATPase domain
MYNKKGEILWNKGRHIKGNSVFKGTGFCKSPIKESLSQGIGTRKENMVVKNPISESAEMEMIKSLIIQPLNNDIFLYIDSGKKEHFTQQERASFLLLGDILEDIAKPIKTNIIEEENGFCGTSHVIKTLRKLVLNYSRLDEPVLLLGETGVGKSHTASLIHQHCHIV